MSGLNVALALYFIDVIDSIKIISIIVLLLFILVVLVYLLDRYLDDSDDELEGFKNKWSVLQRFVKPCSIAVVIACLIAIFAPDKKNLLLIAGAYYGVEGFNNLTESEEMEKLRKLFNLTIDEQIKKLEESK